MPKRKANKSCEMPVEEGASDSSSAFDDVGDKVQAARRKKISPKREKEAGSSKAPSTVLASETSEDDSHDDHDNDGNDEEERASIREEIKNMSFEEIQELKTKLGMKLYNSVMTKQDKAKMPKTAKISKRANKNRPREVGARKPVSVLRDVFEVKKKVARDPRFDDLSGEFSEAVFTHTYKFLDDIRTKEKEVLQKELANEPDEERKEKIKYLLKRIANQEDAKRRKEEARKKKKELGKQLIERAKQGKKPYFLKKSDERKLSLKTKYEEMKRTEKLDKYLERKRKRNASKDKRHLPKHHVQK